MKKTRLFAVVVTVLAILLILPFSASAEEAAKDGWYTDKGYYEYFENGYQYKDGEYWIDEYGSYFRFYADGKMISGDWYRDPDTLAWYYYQPGGYRADDCVVKIGDFYYGFDGSGIMYNDTDFDIWSIETQTSYYYRATKGGSLVTNKWVWFENSYYENGGYWKYFGADGAAYTGIQKIGSAYYYFFDDGIMLDGDTASFYDQENQTDRYVRAKNGGALYCKEWYKDEWGHWYYYNDKAIAAKGLTTVGSATYYFAGDGWMLSDSLYYDDTDAFTYYADKNGYAKKLNKNGWSSVGNDWYYCIDGQFLYDQIKQIGSASYYFDWEGKMLDNEPYGWHDEELGYFCELRAKKGGALYCGSWYLAEDGNYSYYGYDYIRIENELKTIGSGLYYFENGYAVKDRVIELYDGVYVADSSCALTKRSDGWIYFDGDFYYVLNDQLARNCMLEIGSDKYIFDSEGVMECDCISEVYDEEIGWYNYYLLNEDGKVVTKKGWYAYKGDWYYINEDNSLYEGYLDINGTKYALWPAMEYSTFIYDWEYDDTGEHTYLYLLAPDGSYQKITEDGYYNTNYGRMLVENGELFGGWKIINGKFYFFNYAMVTNRVCEIYEEVTHSAYYFDNTGAMQSNSWISYENTYLYADAYGRLADGIKSIGGKNYLFKDYRLTPDSYLVTEDGIYVSDANGIVTLLSNGDGWKIANGYWYYVQYGTLASHFTDIEENGIINSYYFDPSTHRMLSNCYNDGYYFDTYGRQFEGWKLIDGSWYYFVPWKLTGGVFGIDNNRYYFDDNGKMLSNTTYYSWMYDKIFVINAYGVIVDEYYVPDGITYQNGNAYLYKDGEAYHGWYGENYFDYGVMVINRVIEDNGNSYLLDNHGKYVRNGWYLYYDGDWVYADAYGALCEDEWLNLNGVWYYFKNVWMVRDGIHYIEKEDKYALFDEYGKFIKYVEEDDEKQTGKANSWELKDGKWYYYNSTGSMVKDETLYINNAWYCFGPDGIMMTNHIALDYSNIQFYYYSASGARVDASSEWEFINGKWYYFNADSSLAFGWINVNGTRYYIDVEYNYNTVTDTETFELELVTGYQLINGKVYSFDASGACKGEYTGKGWLKLKNGDYVYFKDGKLLQGGIYTIDNTKYYFYEDGTMLANGWTYTTDGKAVYAYASGALYGTGWHNTSNGWIYIDASGELATNGVYKIGNGVYFFRDGYWVP